MKASVQILHVTENLTASTWIVYSFFLDSTLLDSRCVCVCVCLRLGHL